MGERNAGPEVGGEDVEAQEAGKDPEGHDVPGPGADLATLLCEELKGRRKEVARALFFEELVHDPNEDCENEGHGHDGGELNIPGECIVYSVNQNWRSVRRTSIEQ